MSRDYTEITDEQLRAINNRAVEQPSYEQLREQNRVLREALEQAALTICSEFCGSEHHHRECEIVQAALTATSQPGGHDVPSL